MNGYQLYSDFLFAKAGALTLPFLSPIQWTVDNLISSDFAYSRSRSIFNRIVFSLSTTTP